MTNQRTDEYGGTLENRMRVVKEIIEGIHQTCGDDYPISVRLGLKSYVKAFNKASLTGENEAGRTLEEGIEICKMLESYGAVSYTHLIVLWNLSCMLRICWEKPIPTLSQTSSLCLPDMRFTAFYMGK